jgi:hypothetical protein
MKKSYLGILSLVLCGVLAWKFAESGQLKSQIAKLETEVATWKAAAKAPAAVAPPVIAGASSDVAKTAKKTKDAEPKSAEGEKDDPMKAMAKLFSSDATKEMMKNQLKTMIEGMTKDLFELLHLDPATEAKLLDLIVSQQAKGQEVGMKLMTGGTKEEKLASFKEIADNHEATQAAIKALLNGPGQFEQYEKYQDSATERMQLTGIKSKLAGDGKPLDESQEQGLMNLLYSERKAMKWDRDYTKQHEITPEYFAQDSLDILAEETKLYDAQIDAKLPTLLGPEQIESFKGQRAQQRAAEKMGIEFMKFIFGDNK